MVALENPKGLRPTGFHIHFCMFNLIFELYGSFVKDINPIAQISNLRYSKLGWFDFKTNFQCI